MNTSIPGWSPDIERGFKVLKSEIEIGPVYHRLPERIRAHAQRIGAERIGKRPDEQVGGRDEPDCIDGPFRRRCPEFRLCH